MRPSSKQRLYDIRQATSIIQQFVAGRSLDDYRADVGLRSIVERQFITIGEALARIVRDDPQTADQLPDHRRIIGFRNVLVHGYDAIRDELVWEVVETHLPHFVSIIEEMLER